MGEDVLDGKIFHHNHNQINLHSDHRLYYLNHQYYFLHPHLYYIHHYYHGHYNHQH